MAALKGDRKERAVSDDIGQDEFVIDDWEPALGVDIEVGRHVILMHSKKAGILAEFERPRFPVSLVHSIDSPYKAVFTSYGLKAIPRDK